MAVVLTLAALAIGAVAVNVAVGSMTARIDAQLRSFAADPPPRPPEPQVSDASFRPMAVLHFNDDGKLLVADRAGYAYSRLPMPDLDRPTTTGSIVTVPATDGSFDYRAVAAQEDDGIVVAAVPLSDVDSTRDSLVMNMAIAVVVVSLLAILVARFITRRSLRPVDAMIDTATAIAGGDFNRRVEAQGAVEPRTEMGRLSVALNTMMSRLVESIAQRDRDQRRLRRFVGDASHELRTPLAAIRGYAELLRSRDGHDSELLERALERIDSESARMDGLVSDLLLLTTLDESHESDHELVDLSAVTRDAVDDARAADSTRPISATIDGDLVVSGDEPRLRQVLVNLLANARVHTPEATNIAVSLSRVNNDAVLSVSDDGPGIPPEHRAHVFDRFYRADASRSRHTGGSGLGLAIVDSIVRSHDGATTVDATPDGGAEIRVVLPTVRPHPPEEAAH
ncbi:MAG: sensor histidine kinase, partial [Stackebrandtia sp.]